MISFKNKNVLITGASGGIGNDLVKKFVSLGANVLGTGSKAEKLDLIKKMLKNKFGRIVNITSVVGHTGNLGQSNYAASKAAIIGMSKSLAIEYAKKNITINCVSPGFIVSDMTMNIAEKVKLYLTSRIPMGKLGTGEDVSNCVAFLSSDQASYLTGETIHVNGGMYMS